jgi:hypothetical protein
MKGRICRLHLLLALARAFIIESESRGAYDRILLYQIRDLSNLQGQVPLFMSPRNRVGQLYPHELGSLFVASYVSQGCGGGIRTRLHAGLTATHRVRVRVTLRLAVYCQPGLLGAKLLEAQDQSFFFFCN